MAKKKAGRKKNLPLLTEAFPIRVDMETREAMRTYCYEHKLTYSDLIRQLLVEKLRSESYLGK